jgi:SSS family solute:Na+ symporter
MIGIGFYYSRRTKNSDDYLLGGRAMRPWMVGLSLFATLISTITYLSYPGELIRFGPLVLSSVLSLPLIYLVVGWWLIPTLMAIRDASGYALLEKRLGVEVRLLGASVFLVLRLIWMATIIYATANVALLPALDIDQSYSPLVCVILGVVTLGYTSMGGLRAVVLTDVIQSFILLGGALVAVILITCHFGGFQWFPTTWPSHWKSPSFSLGFQDRITVTSSIIFMLTWYICTCGSDQMAIQRFKATQDVAAARRSFGVALIANFLVKVMLGLVGVAVMAYFLDQPDKLPANTTVFTNADEMFPRFIVVGIPIGLTGLVISGIMAAAMSSLSSGISAATSVISDDFIKRFRGLPEGDRATLTEERCISALIGALVVALSLAVGYVPGNLFEITNRVVNALVAPLFVLFFMAIFVPWANAPGAIVGLLASSAVAIAIALFQFMDISMMWIVPSSMVVGIAAGCLASKAFAATARSS